MSEKKRIILGVTGSVAAYKACELVRQLQALDYDVSVIMTHEAEHFVTPLQLSSLSRNKVYRGLFDEQTDASIAHIDLAQKTDCLLIAPATANIISKMACGLADDLLTCICLATRSPILVAPAMNTMMYTNPIIEKNCQELLKRGITIIDPAEGTLACGAQGKGHLADIKDIINAVKQVLSN